MRMDANLRDVTKALAQWLDAGRNVALASVVSTDSSAPRGLGARIAIAGPDEWVGALSGGCTEAAVINQAERLIASGEPDCAALVAYAKETFADVGPVCEATLGVLVEVVDHELVGTLERIDDASRQGKSSLLKCTYASAQANKESIAHPEPGKIVELVRTKFSAQDQALEPQEIIDSDTSLSFSQHELVFSQCIPPALHLVLGGAGDITRELVLMADRLGWRTSVVDARVTMLGQLERMCSPDRIISGWATPNWDGLDVNARTACVALAHESHHDEPFLLAALSSDAFYVGVVGSRKVQSDRRSALRASGLSESVISKLRGPAGLDIGGNSAAEIALAIAAEIVAACHQRSGDALTDSAGPIRA